MKIDSKEINLSAARLEAEMTDANKADWGQLPKMSKGGVFAPADIKLIKDSLLFYAKHYGQLTDTESNQIASLLHRLNNRI